MFGQFRESVILHRDVDGITVPNGEPFELTAGTLAVVNQALGGSFTITVHGNMYRIDGQDADALGKEIPLWPDVEPGASPEALSQIVWDMLATVHDPEIPVNIVDLGLVYRCELVDDERGKVVDIDMTLTAPACGMGPVLVHDVRSRIGRITGIDAVHVELVFDPPWTREKMSEAAQLETGLF